MFSGTLHRPGRIAALVVALVACSYASQSAAAEPYLAVGTASRPPVGWVEFCADNGRECSVQTKEPRDVVLNPKVWASLMRINDWVNQAIRPVTDMEHWGTVEKWSYPDDGYGDCEDYVLLKRKMLVEAGWPRSALLITVVRDRKGDGHAVLTVRTDKGEYILDNQNDKILAWADTGYRFVKRQSQTDPNTWVALGDPRPATATASAR
jgi:predicted transglutaminase-like cysteine proteinase